MSDDADELSLLALFRAEVESHAAVLSEGLVTLETRAQDAAALEPLMRAAHSLKGAARVVGLDAAVRIAHAMEDALVAAQAGTLTLTPARVDLLLRALDWIVALSAESEESLPGWLIAHAEESDRLEQQLAGVATLEDAAVAPAAATAGTRPSESGSAPLAGAAAAADADARAVKVTAEALSRLTGLAAESLVEARRLEPVATSFQHLKARQTDVADLLERVRESLIDARPGERPARLLAEAQRALDDCRQTLVQRVAELDALSRQSEQLSERLYDQVAASRMRPFGDATHGLLRLVRDVARQLGKQARLEIAGRATQVDREILDALEAPLNHLLRNALDHGIEAPDERRAAGKADEGRIDVDASHVGGMLRVRVSDDGRGIDPSVVRRRVVERDLASAEMAEQMDEAELLDFLLLPGFSTRDAVSEISGRGVGLDVVQSMVQAAGGAMRISSEPGRRTEFELRLPVTRSVLRALVTVVDGEPYAVPLAHIDRVVALEPGVVHTAGDRHAVTVEDERVLLVPAREVLEIAAAPPAAAPWPDLASRAATAAVVIEAAGQRFALEVDGFVDEVDLVVHPLDARLGKVPDVTAASTLSDGSPVLILDVDDLVRSIDALLRGGRLTRARAAAGRRRAKRVLVVDDSPTVRELERRLLEGQGYDVDVAVDGMAGWNALRLGDYDLVVTDVDMPRMHGIDLVRRIRADARLRAVPVVIVSYKDRDEDRQRGLEAGANDYLTKSSFQDERLARVVRELIGGPTA